MYTRELKRLVYFITFPAIKENYVKKPIITRRKRRVVAEKSQQSESTDESETKACKINLRRSRSKSIEVSKKRGRPRKNQQTQNTYECSNQKR